MRACSGCDCVKWLCAGRTPYDLAQLQRRANTAHYIKTVLVHKKAQLSLSGAPHSSHSNGSSQFWPNESGYSVTQQDGSISPADSPQSSKRSLPVHSATLSPALGRHDDSLEREDQLVDDGSVNSSDFLDSDGEDGLGDRGLQVQVFASDGTPVRTVRRNTPSNRPKFVRFTKYLALKKQLKAASIQNQGLMSSLRQARSALDDTQSALERERSIASDVKHQLANTKAELDLYTKQVQEAMDRANAAEMNREADVQAVKDDLASEHRARQLAEDECKRLSAGLTASLLREDAFDRERTSLRDSLRYPSCFAVVRSRRPKRCAVRLFFQCVVGVSHNTATAVE
jgi:hypothetical protein